MQAMMFTQTYHILCPFRCVSSCLIVSQDEDSGFEVSYIPLISDVVEAFVVD